MAKFESSIEVNKEYNQLFLICLNTFNKYPGSQLLEKDLSKGLVRYHTPMNTWTWGQRITFQITKLEENKFNVNVESSIPQLVDYGKNKKMVEEVIEILKQNLHMNYSQELEKANLNEVYSITNDKKDALSTGEYSLILLGNLCISPGLGVILYFMWKDRFPNRSKVICTLTWIPGVIYIILALCFVVFAVIASVSDS